MLFAQIKANLRFPAGAPLYLQDLALVVTALSLRACMILLMMRSWTLCSVARRALAAGSSHGNAGGLGTRSASLVSSSTGVGGCR